MRSRPEGSFTNFNPRFPRGKRLLQNRCGPWLALNFNPRFPRGKRLCPLRTCQGRHQISIHASRGGSDQASNWWQAAPSDFNPRFPRGKRLCRMVARTGKPEFQSTLPAGEATIHGQSGLRDAPISIHASRGGSDCAVKLSPNYHTWRHGLREPGFHRFFYRRFPCFFLLGAWGSRL